MNITWFFILFYIGVFAYLSFRSRHFHWLWGSVVLWLGFGIIGARLMPGIWGITHLASFWHPYFYITVASFFFFATSWKWQRETQLFYADASCLPLLVCWAVAGLMQHLAYLVLLFLANLYYPHGTSAFVWLSLMQLYLLQPVWWMLAHLVLMGLLYGVGRRHHPEGRIALGVGDVQAAFLSALVMIAIYVIADMWHFIVL